MNFEEIKQAIKDQCISIGEIYTEDDLRSDAVFGKLYVEYDATKAEHERLMQSIADATRNFEIASSGERLDKLLETGYTDRQRTFIKRQFDIEKIDDLTDEGIAKFVAKSKQRFAEAAGLFGAGYDMEEEALNLKSRQILITMF